MLKLIISAYDEINQIKNATLSNSMLGYFVTFEDKATEQVLGDYSKISQF